MEYMQFPAWHFNHLKLIRCNVWNRHTTNHGVYGVYLFLHCSPTIQECKQLNGVEGIGPTMGWAVIGWETPCDHTHLTPMCHMGVVMCCLSANHSLPHSGPILSYMYFPDLPLPFFFLFDCQIKLCNSSSVSVSSHQVIDIAGNLFSFCSVCNFPPFSSALIPVRNILSLFSQIYKFYIFCMFNVLWISAYFVDALTLSAPALQSYVIHHTRVRQKSHFSKMHFLPQLTIVLHRITKENLNFSPKEARLHYNLSSIMCYPLFVSISKFICPKNTNWWRIRSNFVLLFLL